jgi:hypothetical protein
VSVPFNFGACYYVGHIGGGVVPRWCTGSSSGARWAKQYMTQGLMFNVLDKTKMNSENGKWQVHPYTGQIRNADQSENSDKLFADLFPGLMKKIVGAIKKNGEQIREMSKQEFGKPYDIEKEIEQIKVRFPLSLASVPPEGEEEAEVDQPTQAPAGDNEEDAVAAMMARRGRGAQEPQAEVPAHRGGRPEDIPQARADLGDRLAAVAADQVADADAADQDDGPGLYRITYRGRSINQNFNSRLDARQQVMVRNPNINMDEVETVRIGDQRAV